MYWQQSKMNKSFPYVSSKEKYNLLWFPIISVPFEIIRALSGRSPVKYIDVLVTIPSELGGRKC